MKLMGAPIHILSTKVLDEASVEQAASYNIIIDCIPFIRTEPLTDAATVQKIKDAADKGSYKIFTSVNAVNAVAARLQGVEGWKVFSIEAATRKAVSKYFPQSEIIASADTGAQLAKKIIACKIKDAVFFSGNRRLDTIPIKLKEAGILLKEITVYETVATPVLLTKMYDGILFFSPSGVESFFSINKIDENSVLFSIGKTTAAALAKYTNKIIISKETSELSVCESLISYFSGSGHL